MKRKFAKTSLWLAMICGGLSPSVALAETMPETSPLNLVVLNGGALCYHSNGEIKVKYKIYPGTPHAEAGQNVTVKMKVKSQNSAFEVNDVVFVPADDGGPRGVNRFVAKLPAAFFSSNPARERLLMAEFVALDESGAGLSGKPLIFDANHCLNRPLKPTGHAVIDLTPSDPLGQ